MITSKILHTIKPSLETSIGNITFSFPVCNGSGVWSSSRDELIKLGSSDAGAFVYKSMTIHERSGNPGPRMFMNDFLSLNSMGLPNKGVKYYCDIVNEFRKYNKPQIASIAGCSEEEYFTLFHKINSYPFDAIEVNLSCPNIVGKRVFAYDLDACSRILSKMRSETTKSLGVKLPPYVQRHEIEKMAKQLMVLGIDFVTLINCYPLGAVINADTELVSLKPNNGIGGLGGNALKPIALGQILLYNQYTGGKLNIIGLGGVETGRDVYEFMLAGASAVGIATTLLHEGLSAFTRIKRELITILKNKHISRLKDKIGTVRYWN